MTCWDQNWQALATISHHSSIKTPQTTHSFFYKNNEKKWKEKGEILQLYRLKTHSKQMYRVNFVNKSWSPILNHIYPWNSSVSLSLSVQFKSDQSWTHLDLQDLACVWTMLHFQADAVDVQEVQEACSTPSVSLITNTYSWLLIVLDKTTDSCRRPLRCPLSWGTVSHTGRGQVRSADFLPLPAPTHLMWRARFFPRAV